ncbi:alpha/beta hydrolase [Corynebacterium glyciniphilum]|uniref:alpha/beta hydrolase n=1 Tax=Corynebacterium glyciniphilum TaxID=1404244 RepID=UPI0011AB675A|nr:alpha/beta hydrolase fold domain-containing protein [Corynebacterium glyciniphilum]
MSPTEPHVGSRVVIRVQTRWEYSPTSDGTHVPLLVHHPDQPRGWLVWAHGGSWQYGSARQWAPLTGRIAALSGWAVVSVDYRLAPGHHHPAAVLDTLAALDWAEQQTDGLPIVVGGDSAGGTIAALAALTRRNTGDRVPPQLLAYPPLDPECSRASYRGAPGVPPDRPGLVTAWRLWLGDHTSPRSVPTTPLQADSLTGLASVSLIVGADDPVRDDVRAYAARLQDDGVQVALRTVPNTGHADILDPTGLVLPAVVTRLNELSGDRDQHRSHHYLEGKLP